MKRAQSSLIAGVAKDSGPNVKVLAVAIFLDVLTEVAVGHGVCYPWQALPLAGVRHRALPIDSNSS